MPEVTERARAGHEFRHYALTECEFRAADDDEGFTFEGVASVVDEPYEVSDAFGTFTETVRAGAFTKTLRDSKADVALFVNHDYRGIPLATRNAGTLKLTADPHLRVKAHLDPVRVDVQTLRSAVGRREMSQMSIGFSVPRDKQTWNDDYTDRQIHELKLVETSVVWQGANPLTSTSMRSLAQMLDELKVGDMDEADIRRALEHLTGLLPADEVVEVIPEVFPVTAEELDKFWTFAA